MELSILYTTHISLVSDHTDFGRVIIFLHEPSTRSLDFYYPASSTGILGVSGVETVIGDHIRRRVVGKLLGGRGGVLIGMI